MPDPCPFCPPAFSAHTLWENTAYRIIADQYPRCTGHILIISKTHYPCHMHAPTQDMADFDAARQQARRFLVDVFGKASFLENGNIHQEVRHAHMHSVPITVLLPEFWLDEGLVHSIPDWQAVRQQYEKAGHYTYIETGAGRFMLADDKNYLMLLKLSRAELAAHNQAEMRQSGALVKRSKDEMIAGTIRLWQAWAQTK